jgi:hypothetical protein
MSFATKRTHVDPKKLMSDAKYRIDLGLSAGRSLKDLDQAKDTAGLLEAMAIWSDTPALRCGLDEEDLLIIALSQDLPYAFQVWKEMGQSINADTLLALTLCDESGFPFKSTDALMPFVAEDLKPWHGVVFASLVHQSKGAQSLAIELLKMELVSPETPIPSSQQDVMGWLWWHNPEEKCLDDSTLPIHAALKNRRWDLANYLANAGANLTQADALGRQAIDYLMEVISMEDDTFSRIGKTSSSPAHGWRDRLESLDQAELLENQTAEVGQATPPRRL